MNPKLIKDILSKIIIRVGVPERTVRVAGTGKNSF